MVIGLKNAITVRVIQSFSIKLMMMMMITRCQILYTQSQTQRAHIWAA